MLRLRNVTKSYREGQEHRFILAGAELELPPSGFTALLGRSGSGKSTLLHLLAGLDRCDEGEIWWNGANLTALDTRGWTLFRRHHIGFVFQFFHLFPTLTVAENVAMSVQLTGRGGDRIEALLRRVGLWERRQAYPDRLSGGEQQRVAVARALVHRPEMVLADEPTGNLDQENGRLVMELLTELCREQGSLLLIATHSGEVAAAADRLVRIQEGSLQIEEQP